MFYDKSKNKLFTGTSCKRGKVIEIYVYLFRLLKMQQHKINKPKLRLAHS